MDKVLYEISHCYNCKIGGCGWKEDNLPYYFCSPECICEFKGEEYNSDEYFKNTDDEDTDDEEE